MNKIADSQIAIVGLGYVGLPLALELAAHMQVIGFDINKKRIEMMQRNEDPSKEVEADRFAGKDIVFTDDSNVLKEASFFIVTVPTPVDDHKVPDLTPLEKASETVGKVLKKGDYVIYESTTYPGCTEEDCVPILEQFSGLTLNKDFFVGYSPERINPGDQVNTLSKICKVTSGSNLATAHKVNLLYQTIITAGTHLAPSIKVAEASKAIENAQRDVNISFVNELALIFDRMGIDTHDVIDAAATKWNFLKFKPGLVGGHCIGVDPYYLAQKAQEAGYHPEIILAGRRLNDSMGEYVASQVVKLMIKKGITINTARVLMLGITFKENCPDVRNTKIVDVIHALSDYGIDVSIYDPWASAAEVKHEYGLTLSNQLTNEQFDGIVLGVAHKEFLTLDFDSIKKEHAIVYDVKGILTTQADGKL